MNAAELIVSDTERRALLGQLFAAEALQQGRPYSRRGTRRQAHMESAIPGLLEAYIAINRTGRARAGHQLVMDHTKIELPSAICRPQPTLTVFANPVPA